MPSYLHNLHLLQETQPVILLINDLGIPFDSFRVDWEKED